MEEYNELISVIDVLSISPEEKSAYLNYYNFLINIKQENRHIHDLTVNEKGLLEYFANGDFEVSPFAKSILEWREDYVWNHEIEELSMNILNMNIDNRESEILYAVPNPTTNITTINSLVEKISNVKTEGLLVIRNSEGKVVFESALTVGKKETRINVDQWNSGTYFYSLYINGRLIESKKLIINR